MTTVLGVLQPPIPLVTHQKDSQDLEAVVLIGMVYYSKRTLTRGKKYIRQSLEESRYRLQSSLSGGMSCHKEHTSSSSSELQQCMCSVCVQGSLPRVFIEGQSCKQFRPSEEKHMFIINHLLCTNNLGKLVQQGLLSQAFKIATSVSNVRKILKTKDHSSNQALLKSNIRPALSPN